MTDIRYFSIDILRGVAAIFVLLTHWGDLTAKFAEGVTKEFIYFFTDFFHLFFWAAGGVHPGVIIFIVISGFCIHFPNANEKEKPWQSGFWKRYFFRRFFRIFPVLWFGLMLGLLSVLLAEEGSVLKIPEKFWNSLISALGLAEIFRFFINLDWYPGNGPLSTVCVEVLLYLTYPLLLISYRYKGFLTLFAFTITMYGAIALARALGVSPEFLHGTWFEFLLYWILGAIAAEIYIHSGNKLDIFNSILIIIIAFVCYGFFSNLIKIKGIHVVTTFYLSSMTAMLLIVCSVVESRSVDGKIRHFLRLLSICGSRSYSLYIVHMPTIFLLLWWLKNCTNVPTNAYPVITLFGVLLATELTFRIVERPSHKFARRNFR